jgi:hypothetical protein
MNKYMPQYFKLYELLSKDMYENLLHEQIGWGSLDSRILYTIDQLRIGFDKPIIINNWYFDGCLNYRGFRPFNCGIGAENSQHKYGRAVDINVKGLTSEEVNDHIIKNQKKYEYITFLETGKSWTHIDCRNSIFEGLHIFQN